VPDVTDDKREFKIGRPTVVRQGRTLRFLPTATWSGSPQGRRNLEKKGVSVRVVNVSTLKPIDGKRFRRLTSGVKGVVTVEEHTIIGGLASAIAFALRGQALPIEAVAVQDCFGQSALNYEQLLEHYGLTDAAVVKAVKKVLRQ